MTLDDAVAIIVCMETTKQSATAVALPTTTVAWCAHFKRLDIQYGTDKRSPLHHDHRCPVCKSL